MQCVCSGKDAFCIFLIVSMDEDDAIEAWTWGPSEDGEAVESEINIEIYSFS